MARPGVQWTGSADRSATLRRQAGSATIPRLEAATIGEGASCTAGGRRDGPNANAATGAAAAGYSGCSGPRTSGGSACRSTRAD